MAHNEPLKTPGRPMTSAHKTVYLLRHAKSAWDDPSLGDRDRPLNKRGRRAAPLMGQRLHVHGHRPDRIVSSPANRALTTAQIVADETGVGADAVETDARLYFGGLTAMCAVLGESGPTASSCMIAGHNPDMTRLLNHMTGVGIANMVTAAIAIVRFDVDSWADLDCEEGTLVGYSYPKGPDSFGV